MSVIITLAIVFVGIPLFYLLAMLLIMLLTHPSDWGGAELRGPDGKRR